MNIVFVYRLLPPSFGGIPSSALLCGAAGKLGRKQTIYRDWKEADDTETIRAGGKEGDWFTSHRRKARKAVCLTVSPNDTSVMKKGKFRACGANYPTT